MSFCLSCAPGAGSQVSLFEGLQARQSRTQRQCELTQFLSTSRPARKVAKNIQTVFTYKAKSMEEQRDVRRLPTNLARKTLDVLNSV
eukprot:4592625-Amphidinium_carterae.1